MFKLEYFKTFKIRCKVTANQEELFQKQLNVINPIYKDINNEQKAYYDANGALFTQKHIDGMIKTIVTNSNFEDKYKVLSSTLSEFMEKLNMNLSKLIKQNKTTFIYRETHKSPVSYLYFDYQKNIDELHNYCVNLPYYGCINFLDKSRNFDDVIFTHVTLYRDPIGEFYLLFKVKQHKELEDLKPMDLSNTIGIDIDNQYQIVTSNNDKGSILWDDYNKAEIKIDKLEERLSKLKENSRRAIAIQVKIFKQKVALETKIKANQYKIANDLVSKYDYLAIQRDNFNNRFNDEIQISNKTRIANSSGQFIKILKDVCYENGKKLEIIDSSYTTTKMCSSCGEVLSTLQLGDKIIHCPKCGKVIDRDVNAAINIRKIAFKI